MIDRLNVKITCIHTKVQRKEKDQEQYGKQPPVPDQKKKEKKSEVKRHKWDDYDNEQK